jgi:hypothetical protein
LNKSRIFKRSYHITKLNKDINNTLNSKNIILDLYKNRIAPVSVFDDKVLLSCNNILDLKERNNFLKNLENLTDYEKGGIYIFQYKDDSNIYYIGRTTSFSSRFRSHIKYKTSDKFHVFANLVG